MAKSDPLLVFEMKFSWNTAVLTCLLIVYVSFCTTELSSCDRNHVAHKPKICTVWPLTEKACIPSIRVSSILYVLQNSRGEPVTTTFVWQCSPSQSRDSVSLRVSPPVL